MDSASFNPSGIVTLLTDFGLIDTYVGQMKGVILSIAPTLRIVDLSHQVAPQAIEEGAFHLHSSVDAFPAGTVHVAVVDPGVGTNRRAICVEAGGDLFVGPDNGILDLILPADVRVVEVRNRAVLREAVTATFHGRDVFAPAAAHLAAGLVGPVDLGPRVSHDALVRLPSPVEIETDHIAGRIVSIDRFGNCITLVGPEYLPAVARPGLVGCKQFKVDSIERTFADVADGEPVAYVGSSGTLELAVRNGSAAQRYGLRRGDWVKVLRANG